MSIFAVKKRCILMIFAQNCGRREYVCMGEKKGIINSSTQPNRPSALLPHSCVYLTLFCTNRSLHVPVGVNKCSHALRCVSKCSPTSMCVPARVRWEIDRAMFGWCTVQCHFAWGDLCLWMSMDVNVCILKCQSVGFIHLYLPYRIFPCSQYDR